MFKKAVQNAVLLGLIAAGAGRAQQGQPAPEGPDPLAVAANGHDLVDSRGDPVFLTGDTAWRAITQLSREEMTAYIAKRKAQGFNTILFAALPWQNSESGNRTVYGDEPFHRTGKNYDLSRPDVTPNADPGEPAAYDYWDHMDFFVELARREKVYLAVLPCWAARWITRDTIFTPATAYGYGRWLGARYRDYGHILWVLGGDTRPGDNQPIYHAMAEGLADGVNGVDEHDGKADYSTTLMTYHEPKEWSEDPEVFDTSATWFHEAPWLDFNSSQEHPEKAVRAILADFARKPSKPIWLFEGRYEAYRKDEDTPAWDDWGVRYQAYQSVFAGGFGHVYGHEGVFSFGAPVGHADSGVDWRANLDSPGAVQAGYVGRLMRLWASEQRLSRIPANDLIEGRIGASPLSNDPRPGSDRIAATKAADGSIAMVYFANGRSASIRTAMLAGPAVDAYWFNPRTGQWRAGDKEGESRLPFRRGIESGSASAGPHEFDPPGEAREGNDWVLVLERR